MSSEADVISKFDHELRSAIEEQNRFYDVEYSGIRRELYIGGLGGYADLVIETGGGDPLVVIEAKREPVDEPDRNIDPYSIEVINQAAGYALQLGAPYFATYNGQIAVLFKTLEPGTPLLDQKTKEFQVDSPSEFSTQFLEEVARIDSGVAQWTPAHRAFIKRLETFHNRLAEEFRNSLEDRLTGEGNFTEQYERWMDNQGWLEEYHDDPADVNRKFVSQAAYLLMNKLVFYKLLEDANAYDVPIVNLEDLVEPEARREVFSELIRALDFEAIYESDPIFDGLPLTSRAETETGDLLRELEDYDLTRFNHDVIGRIYERILPPEERHALGQYYTPPKIVELITRTTIRSPDDEILDPGCGSGGFLIGGYNRLKAMKEALGHPTDHQNLLEQIHGIDINRFPAHLSAINLALQDLSSQTHDVNVEVEDFFNVVPSQDRVRIERASVGSSARDESTEYDVSIPPKVDAVVANPPYIRFQNLPEHERYLEHLEELDADITGHADIYAYFFTHAYQFLEEGGKIGFITSNRWLTVGYGEDLQEFFTENTRIKAIIDFRRQLFEVPLINTCVVILEVERDERAREENVVNLVHWKTPIEDINELVELVEDNFEPGTFEENEDRRRVALKQSDLSQTTKWNRYLYAPQIYWKVLTESSNEITQLKELAEVSYGLISGRNSFFYFQFAEDYQELGIEEECVSPILKHISPTEYLGIRTEDPVWYVLDIHDIAEEILSERDSSLMEHQSKEEIVKEGLEDRGLTGTLEYIKSAEKRGDGDLSIQRSIWFDVGELDRPPIFLPKEYWRDSRVPYNEDGVGLDQRNYAVEPMEEVDPMVLLGIMNSSLFALLREMEGRTEQGQAMSRNELTATEAKNMHVPDVREFSKDEQQRIGDIMESWLDDEREASEDWIDSKQIELDKAVLEPLGMAEYMEEIREAVKKLIQVREETGGENTDILVEAFGEGDMDLKIEGSVVDADKSQTNLGDY